MSENVLSKINKIPVRTWSWLGVNDVSVDHTIPEITPYPSMFITNEDLVIIESDNIEPTNLKPTNTIPNKTIPDNTIPDNTIPDNTIANNTKHSSLATKYSIHPMDATKNNLNILNSFDFEGISTELTNQAKTHFNTGFYLETLPNQTLKTPIEIHYSVNQSQNTVVDNNVIIAKENSEVTIMVEYKSDDDFENIKDSKESKAIKGINVFKEIKDNKESREPFHNGLTRIYCEKGATVNLIKIQSLTNNSNHFDACIASLEEEANINYIFVELGSQNSITNVKTDLKGSRSTAGIHTVYLGDKDRKIDINYLVNHYGKETKSIIEAKGALLDKSSKIFKGTLDFKKGAKKAVGQEEEYAVLLSKEVRNRSVPILLCSEDDVSGQHAASAGKIDENKLFYLMTRGFSEAEAKKLIIEAAISPIIDLIPKEEKRTSIYDVIRRKLTNE
jgi:FeS assembly protein SufD